MIVFEPTLKAIEPEALPLVIEVPFTVTVAVASDTVGVTVIELVALDTEAVYDVVPDAKVGLNVPELKARLARFALVLAARVTVTV